MLTSKRKLALQLLKLRGVDTSLEPLAFAKDNYELTIRRLCAGFSLEDAFKLHSETVEKKMIIHDGVNKCGKCGSRKVLDTSMQTRSADEAMTHFFKCTICKNSWKT